MPPSRIEICLPIASPHRFLGSLLALPLASFVLVLLLLYLLRPTCFCSDTPGSDRSSRGGWGPTITRHGADPWRILWLGQSDRRGIERSSLADWEAFTGFLQREPDEGQPVSERTEIRILVGADALYAGVGSSIGNPRDPGDAGAAGRGLGLRLRHRESGFPP